MITKKSLYRCVALAVLSMAAASQAQALTRQEFAKAADAICVKAATAGQALVTKASLPIDRQLTLSEYRKLAPIAASVITKEIDQIAKLDAPKADRAEIKKMLDILRDLVKKIKKDPKILAQNAVTAQADKIALKLGLKECGN